MAPVTDFADIIGTGLSAVDIGAVAADLLTTKGDLIGATGRSAPTRLGVGSNDQILVADATQALGMAYKWAIAGGTNLGLVMLSRTVNQSITTGTWTACSFDSEVVDNENMHDTVTNNSRITFTIPGVYLLGGAVAYGAVTDQQRAIIQVYKNGVAYSGRAEIDSSGTIGGPSPVLVVPIQAAATDYVELMTLQTSTGTQAIDHTLTTFWALRLLRTG